MATSLTAQQIAQYAYGAGFRGDQLQTAVAVALAESHGDPGIHGDVNLETGKWGPSVGLWQIRSLNPGHGTAAEQRLRNAAANADPATNARNAYTISKHGRDFSPWSTYTDGSYRRYLSQAGTAAHGVGRPAAPTSYQVRPSALDQLAAGLTAQAQRLRSIQGEVGAPELASSAFGGLPQSGQAAEAHGKLVESLTSQLADKLSRASALSTGVQASSANYQQGDQTVATSYLSLVTD